MLIKEYRIPLPLTVEEYKIAQLYIIQVSVRIERVFIARQPHLILSCGLGERSFEASLLA